jgi:hypothetical protein
MYFVTNHHYHPLKATKYRGPLTVALLEAPFHSAEMLFAIYVVYRFPGKRSRAAPTTVHRQALSETWFPLVMAASWSVWLQETWLTTISPSSWQNDGTKIDISSISIAQRFAFLKMSRRQTLLLHFLHD